MMTNQERRRPGPKDAAGGDEARLNRDVQLKIGEGLRAMYDDVVKQGVPDRFANLLAEIDRKQANGKDSQQK